MLGAVAWTVLTRAELAVYVQALRRRALAPRIKNGKRFNLMIRYTKRHKCGLKSITLKHPFKLVFFADAAFKVHAEEPTGLALRGLAATLQEDGCSSGPMGTSGGANLVDFTVRSQRRIVRYMFIAELYGLVDSVERRMSPQVTLHQAHCGTARSPEVMVDLLEFSRSYPPLDL